MLRRFSNKKTPGRKKMFHRQFSNEPLPSHDSFFKWPVTKKNFLVIQGYRNFASFFLGNKIAAALLFKAMRVENTFIKCQNFEGLGTPTVPPTPAAACCLVLNAPTEAESAIFVWLKSQKNRGNSSQQF